MTRLLLIDGDEDLRDFLVELLSKHGFAVTPVGSRDAALPLLVNRPDVILMSRTVPGLGLAAFMAEICRHGLADRVVLMCSFVDEDELRQLGIQHAVPKPCPNDELCRVVRRCARQKFRTQSAGRSHHSVTQTREGRVAAGPDARRSQPHGPESSLAKSTGSRRDRIRLGTTQCAAEIAVTYGVSVPNSPVEPTLSPNQIGEKVGVTGEAVKYWIRHCKLPAARLGNGHYKVTKADLERFIQVRLNGGRRRILLVGMDEETIRELAGMLDPGRYDIITTNSKVDALLKAQDLRPSLVVVAMSELANDGWDLVKKLRSSIRLRRTRVLVLASTMGTSERHEATNPRVMVIAGSHSTSALAIEIERTANPHA